MKKYTTPELEIEGLEAVDIITTSSGAKTPELPEEEGNWQI